MDLLHVTRATGEQNPEDDEEYLQGSQQCQPVVGTPPHPGSSGCSSVASEDLSKSPQNSCLSQDPDHASQCYHVSLAGLSPGSCCLFLNPEPSL